MLQGGEKTERNPIGFSLENEKFVPIIKPYPLFDLIRPAGTFSQGEGKSAHRRVRLPLL